MKIMKSCRKSARRKIISSRRVKRQPVMAGAGSGITIEFSGIEFGVVTDSILKGSTLKGTATGTIDIEHIGTYYEGGSVNEILPCEIDFELNADNTDELNSDIEEYGIDAILLDLEYEKNALIGGGWTHSTFDGVFSFECWDMSLGGILTVTLTDLEYVQYLDRLAHGENRYEEYTVYVDDEPFETYDSEIEATTRANDLCDFDIDDNDELLKDVYVERVEYIEYYNGNCDVEGTEIIWNSTYDYV